MHHIQGQNREQIRMISLEQMVEKNSLVRIIDAFVDMLDLEQFGFSYFKLNKEGRPPLSSLYPNEDLPLWLPEQYS